MLSRRHFAAFAAAQVLRRTSVAVCFDRRRDGLQFTRAYAACPEPEGFLQTLRTGRYPHGVSTHTPTLETLFRGAGYRIDPGEGPFFAFGVDSLAGIPADALVVNVGRPGGDWQESNIRIPIGIRWTGRIPSGSADWVLSSVDVAPTLLGLCGLSPLEQCHGTDRSDLILGNRTERPEAIYAEGMLGQPGEWRMLIRGWDKLVVDRHLQVTHLYNLALDPEERQNLTEGRNTIRKQEELLALLRRWILDTGDRVPYPRPR